MSGLTAANDIEMASTFDHLTISATFLDCRFDMHRLVKLQTFDDSRLAAVRIKPKLDPVTDQNFNAVETHLPG